MKVIGTPEQIKVVSLVSCTLLLNAPVTVQVDPEQVKFGPAAVGRVIVEVFVEQLAANILTPQFKLVPKAVIETELSGFVVITPIDVPVTSDDELMVRLRGERELLLLIVVKLTAEPALIVRSVPVPKRTALLKVKAPECRVVRAPALNVAAPV